MSIKDKYFVKSINSYQYNEWLLKKHYAKRLPCIEYSFGLFDKDNLIIGVITFGTPPSPNLREVFLPHRLIELNRLCVNEGLERNVLSFFVSKSLKLLSKPVIVVSYADTAQNHHGYIYQATNFIYTGLSAKRTDWKIKGLEHLHGATVADMSRGKENRADYMRTKFGDDFYLEDRSRKHRYFKVLGIKNFKLPYPMEPYPKGDNKRYDASFNPIIQRQLF